MENILEKRRVKIEKNEDEKFLTFYLSCSLQNMITNISIFSDHKINKIFGFFLLKNCIIKLYFHQGGLNEKKTELNLCGIFSISISNEFYLLV